MGSHDTIEVEVPRAGASIVTLRGEHDLSSRPQLTVALAVAQVSDSGDVLVDLTHATFVDSCVINALLRTTNELVRAGKRLEVVVPPSALSMRSLFEAVAVTRLMPIHDTRQAGAAGIGLAVRQGVGNPGLRMRALVQPVEPASLDEVEAHHRVG